MGKIPIWRGCLELDGSSLGVRCYRQGRPQPFVRGGTSRSMGVKKIRYRCSIGLVRNRIHQIGGFKKLVVGTIDGLEKIQIVELFPLVTRKQRSGHRSRSGRGWCDRDHHLCRFRSDLSFLQSHGRKAAGVSRLGDLADGECETFGHGGGSWDDDHLVRLESCTHTPYLTRHCRRKLVDSLPWGIPTVVVYRQTGAQAMNSMVTQDTDMDFI